MGSFLLCTENIEILTRNSIFPSSLQYNKLIEFIDEGARI